MQASMSVMPSSWKVSTKSSAEPRTSRKWPNAIRSCAPKCRITAGRSSQNSAKFPWHRQMAFAWLSTS